MRKPKNEEYIEGRVFQHNLSIKTVQNDKSENYGKSYISGDLDVAVDEEGLNVLKVHYSYVAESTKKGNTNSTFSTLKEIIDNGKAWITDGKDTATKVKITTALALNDFYVQNDQLVSAKRNEGGFINIVNTLVDEGIDRHKFKMDMLINSLKMVESEDKPEDTHMVVKGAVFNFRNEILPVEFVVRNPDGMNYFESLNISPSNLVYVNLWGKINSITTKERREVESAFGGSDVTFVERNTKEWTITGVNPNFYEFGDPSVLTMEEVTEALQNREIKLAELKRQREEWENNKTNAGPTGSANLGMNPPVTAKAGGFNF